MFNKPIQIDQPGVTVFGSWMMRVQPDSATVQAGVSRIAAEPKTAFAEARAAAGEVQKFLKDAGPFGDFGSSRITLAQETRFVQGEHRFIGYQARIGYSLVVRELDRLEEILVGLVAAGANELNSMSFESSRLKELRAQARKAAIAAAREKAELYCSAAGVSLGAVRAIVDNNPEVASSGMHVKREEAGSGASGSIDPASIIVSASVFMTFEIKPAADELQRAKK
ncbi:MAG TPA: SIMPL domain-containing protein [Tepidisphaeraceae bacterium]|nr:SIMPL domain-containing protein [Tepidisphaeraceae bacterium]